MNMNRSVTNARIRSTNILVVSVLAILAPLSTASDNFLSEREKSIKVYSETILSGINLRDDTFPRILEKLGKPSRTKMTSPRIEWGRTFVTGVYEWETRVSWLRLTTLNENRLEPKIVSLEVWGSGADGEIGTTERGLKLGDLLKDVRRVYGLRIYLALPSPRNIHADRGS
jgi:hypothetical protein